MKKALISLVCLIILAALYACGNAGNEDLKASDAAAVVIPFERISPDALGSDLTSKIDMARAEEGYELLTSGNDNYIVVYAGERPTAGHGIEITSISAENGKTKVTVKEKTPAEGDITAQVLTYPFDVASFESPVSGNVEIEIVK